ncbi:DUF2285 domain-containing protein [Mesorhizobium sp. M0959]|uniref:DNA -binding domain-containing protein n=1 Tax=Mesorhizobium sp. M0959 TaxID=2957034 RepID=UPI00333D3307
MADFASKLDLSAFAYLALADPRDHLRDRIRRAIHRGHALMNGGYRDFLERRNDAHCPFRQLSNKSL